MTLECHKLALAKSWLRCEWAECGKRRPTGQCKQELRKMSLGTDRASTTTPKVAGKIILWYHFFGSLCQQLVTLETEQGTLGPLYKFCSVVSNCLCFSFPPPHNNFCDQFSLPLYIHLKITRGFHLMAQFQDGLTNKNTYLLLLVIWVEMLKCNDCGYCNYHSTVTPLGGWRIWFCWMEHLWIFEAAF